MRNNLPVTQREYPFLPTDAIVSTTDLQGNITYCNETFVRISGFNRDELIGAPQNILRHPDMPREAFRDLWTTIRAGQPWSAIVKNRRCDGDHYWVRANVTPIVAGGETVGYLSVRTCPGRDEVTAAATLYASMRKEEETGHRLPVGLNGGAVVRRHPLARLRRWLGQSPTLRIGLVLAAVMLLPVLPHLLDLVVPVQKELTFAMSAAGVVLGTLALRRQVAAPMAHFAAQANIMAAGDLAQGNAGHGGALSAGLARALNQLNVNLRAVVGDVRTEIVQMGASADEVARGAGNLATRTETQSASLEQAAAAMEEFTSVLQQSQHRSSEARSLADAVALAAGEGKSAIDEVREAMTAISTAARNISDVTSLVDELAFQTNLLALNAAVEAARAGEHGRGFAVVAGEVRTLARRSTMASKEIRQLVGASLEQVEQGGCAVQGADTRMQSIVEAAARVRMLIEDMANASAEQAEGVNQINSMITQLDEVTQRNAALVGEATAAAQALRVQASMLEQSVAIFQLEAPSVADPAPAPAALSRQSISAWAPA